MEKSQTEIVLKVEIFSPIAKYWLVSWDDRKLTRLLWRAFVVLTIPLAVLKWVLTGHTTVPPFWPARHKVKP